MNIITEDNKEVPGKVIKFFDGSFQTLRYVLEDGQGFIVVNPFGDARIAPKFDTFDQAMGMAFADVENQKGSRAW